MPAPPCVAPTCRHRDDTRPPRDGASPCRVTRWFKPQNPGKGEKKQGEKNNFQIMLWFMFVHINLFVFRRKILRKSKNFQISLEGFEVEIEFRNSENIVCFSAPGSTTPPSYPRNPEVVKWIWVALKDVSKWDGVKRLEFLEQSWVVPSWRLLIKWEYQKICMQPIVRIMIE